MCVTLIYRSDCRTSRNLLREVSGLYSYPGILFRVVDLIGESPPPFVQGHVVPATYIGERLWRHGKFTWQVLEKRLRQELNESEIGEFT